MARITSGQDFGRDVAQPRRLNESIVPNAAFGSTTALRNEGDALVREGLQQEHAQAMARKQAEREAQQAREAADRAMAGARMGVLSDKLTDLIGEIDEGVQTGAIDKTAATQEWQQRSARVLADGLPEIPETHRENARVGLQGQAERLTSKVGGIVKKRDQADTLAGINGTIEYTQRLARENPDAAKQIMADTLDGLGPHAGLRPDQIAKAKQGWVEGAAYTRAFSAVTAAKMDNKALGVAEKAISANKDLDPQRQAQLLSQIDGYRAANEARAIRAAQRAEIAAAKHEREAVQAFNVLSGWALAGKAANPEASAALIGKLSGTPYAEAYKALAAEVPARAAAAMLPLDQQQQQLDGLIARRNAQGTSEPLEKEITRREEILRSARSEYTSEPLRAGAERGVIDQVRPLDVSSFDGIAAGLGERMEQANIIATRTGRPVSPLLTDEALKIGDMLGALGPTQRSQRIAQLTANLPPGMAQALARQIDGKDRALGLQMAASTDQTSAGRYTSELIARGAQAIKDKSIKEDSAAASGLKAQLAVEVGDSLTGKAREDVIDAARFIYLGQQAEGNSLSVRGAVRLAVGGDIVEHNGKRIPVTAGIDETVLMERLRTLPPAGVLQQAPDGVVHLPGAGPMSVPDFLARLPAAQLEPAGTGRYTVRSGGSLVTNSNARPIIIEVR
jgi:hypothetical protein